MRKISAVVVASLVMFGAMRPAYAGDNAALGLIIGGTLGLIIGNEIGRDNDRRDTSTTIYYSNTPQVYMISPPPPPRYVQCFWEIVGYDRYGRPLYQQRCW